MPNKPIQLKKELIWLFRRSVRHSGSVAAVAALGLLGTLTGLGSSVASKYLVDALVSHNKAQLLISAFIMALMLGSSPILAAISGRVSTRIRVRLRNAGQKQIFRQILRADWQSLEPYNSGDLLQRLNSDMGIVSEGIIGFLPGIASLVLRFLGAVAIMLYFDPTMVLLTVLAMPATMLLSQLLMRPLRTQDRAVKELCSRIMSFQEETFRNVASIKAFGVAERFVEDMDKLQQEYESKSLQMNKTQNHISIFTALFSTLLIGICMSWGAWRLWRGNMTFGSLTMFLQLMAVLRSAFSGVMSLSHHSITLANSAGRIMNLEALPEEDSTVPAGLEQEQTLSLSVTGASFAYKNGDVVLQPFDFSARPGETVAVTGPSGEGKTTLLRLLLGLVPPAQSSAVLTGKNTYPLSAGTRCKFAYVPQGNSILAGTVADNLRLACPEATEDELWQVLDAACAREFVAHLPDGLNHKLGAGGRGISEGQAQRLAIARALLKGAPILLLDEATSALDLATEEKLLESLRTSKLVKTCILVTHRPASAAFCDRGYDIRDGYVTEVAHGE
ncbi:MAG: ABC transporter ATP-binding protein [Oscillospiraceae bacterium]|nr:ABC transporter ATP-binding protein [Oscillospiraceae bacterium]